MMERLRSRFSVSETCLIANMCSSSAEFEKACMASVQFVNMTVCLTTYEVVTEIERMMMERNLVAEALPLSSPAIRIMNRLVTQG